MFFSSRPLASGLSFCLALCALPALAADNVLSVIPENSLGFVVIQRIGEADQKVAEVAKLMELPVPSVLELAKLQANAKEGVDAMGSLALFALASEDPGGVPVPVTLVPTTDYQSFLKQFEPEDAGDGIHKVRIAGLPLVVGTKGGYAVLTTEEHQARLKEVLDSSKSVNESVEPLRPFLKKSDIGVVMTTAGVKLSMAKALEGLAIMKAEIERAGPDAQAAVAGLAMYEAMVAAMKENVTHIGLSIRVDADSNVHAASRVLFDSGMAEIKAQDPPKPRGLAGLPAESFVFALSGVLPRGDWDSMLKYSVQMVKTYPGGEDLTDQQITELTRLSAQSMKGLQGMSMVMGVGKPGASLYRGMSLLMHVDNAETYMKNYAKMLREMSEWGKEAKLPLYQFDEPKQIKIGDTTGMQFAMDMSAALGAAGENPAAREMLKKLFGGEDKLNFFLAPVDERTVAVAYVSKDALIEVMKAAKKPKTGLAADPSVAKTAAMLPADSQWVIFISPKGAIEFANNMAATFAPGGPAAMIPAFPQTPPVGISANSSMSKLDVDLVVPASLLKAIGGYIQTVRGDG